MPSFNPVISYESSLVIPSGSTTTNSIDLMGASLVGFILPNQFTGTSISFQLSVNDNTYNSIYNKDGTLLQSTVAPNRAILLNPGDFVGVRWIKLVSNATEPTSRTIQLITRSL